MELTTRCPQCQTAFTVSLEQLQLRKGYIRCIHCAHIFDGYEAVVPSTSGRADPPAVVQTNSAPRSTTPVSAAPDTPAQPFSIGNGPSGLDQAARGSEHSIGTSAPYSSPAAPKEPELPAVVRQRAEMRAGSSQVGPSFTISEPRDRSGQSRNEPAFVSGDGNVKSAPRHVIRDTSAITISEEEAGKSLGTNDFVFVEPRAGHRQDRQTPEFFGATRKPRAWMTPVWAFGVLAGLVLLLAQGLYIYRVQLANSFPSLRPMLEQACERIGCAVPYDRRIDAIAITGSALRSNAAPQGDVSTLTLEVTLRNTYVRSQEWPTLVLDLKDASGTVVVRRNMPPDVWVPSQLRDQPFGAGSEVTVQLPVNIRGLQANGYQLDKFFP